jgi:hypothetical protein
MTGGNGKVHENGSSGAFVEVVRPLSEAFVVSEAFVDFFRESGN